MNTDPADRALARDLTAMLSQLTAAVRDGRCPRWLMLVINPPVQMVAHIVRDFLERQECAR